MEWLVTVKWEESNGKWEERLREFGSEEEAHTYAKLMYESFSANISVCVYKRTEVFC